MQAVVMTVFQVFLFPREGRIMTIYQLSFYRPEPSSGVSTVPMIDNPQPDIVNVGVGLCAPLMGTFDYPPPNNSFHYMSVIPDQPRAKIFQNSSFCMTYFNDQWTLPSPLATMEGTGHHGMSMPLSVVEFVYSIVQQASADPDLTPAQNLDPVLKLTWAQGSLTDIDSLELVFPSHEDIIEEMTSPERPQDDLHHQSYFLPELRRIESVEFTLTMTGDKACPINPLATHDVYAEGNMKNIVEMIPIDISKIPGIVENIFVAVDCSPEEIQIYTDLFKEFRNMFA
jgi:hypothetical protein